MAKSKIKKPLSIKYKTYSETTSTYGEIIFDLPRANFMIVGIANGESYEVCIPYSAGTYWACTVRRIQDMTPIANYLRYVTVAYVDRP